MAEAEKKALEIKEQYQEGLLTDSERYNKIIEIWQGAKNRVEDLVPETMEALGPGARDGYFRRERFSQPVGSNDGNEGSYDQPCR